MARKNYKYGDIVVIPPFPKNYPSNTVGGEFQEHNGTGIFQRYDEDNPENCIILVEQINDNLRRSLIISEKELNKVNKK